MAWVGLVTPDHDRYGKRGNADHKTRPFVTQANKPLPRPKTRLPGGPDGGIRQGLGASRHRPITGR